MKTFLQVLSVVAVSVACLVIDLTLGYTGLLTTAVGTGINIALGCCYGWIR